MEKSLKNRIGFIYKLTSPNGKIYIGQTINKKQRKYHYNSNDFKSQNKLWNNVKKYNWKPSDTFEIIEEVVCGENKSILNEREIFWIKYFNSFQDGLNCNAGGCGNIGYIQSKETRKKMSLSKIGIKHPDWRNKQKSEYTKGRKHTNDSKKKMSEVKIKRMNKNIKKKISIGLIGNKNGKGNKGKSKKILCITNGVIYDSIKKASITLLLREADIIDVCKNKKKEIKNYKFIYYEENCVFNGSGN